LSKVFDDLFLFDSMHVLGTTLVKYAGNLFKVISSSIQKID